MLKIEELKPNSIEEVICKPFAQLLCAAVNPMSDDLSRLLITLIGKSKKTPNIKEEEKPFVWQMMQKRLAVVQSFSIPDDRLMLFLSVLTDRAGIAVMYLWYLQYWCYKNQVKEIDLEMFCQRIFPHGFPSEIELEVIYVAQKVRSESSTSNLMDIFAAGESIRIKN